MPFSPFRTGIPLVDRNLDAIAAALNPVAALGIGAQPVWTLAELGNGFVDLTVALALDANAARVAYRKDATGIVWGKGIVYNTSGGTLTNETAYTMPAGFRPLERRSYVGRLSSGGAMAFIVDHNGDVAVHDGLVNGAWVSLEFSFPAEQ